MASRPTSAVLTVDQLLDGVRRLPPTALREFRRRFRVWQEESGSEEGHPAVPRPAEPDGMSAMEERRLRRLIARSERGLLTPQELAEYRALARRSEQVSATRLQELAALAGGKKSGKKGDARGA